LIPQRTGIAIALAIIYLVWGSSFVATKVLVTEAPPLLAAGLRFVLAGLLVGAFAWWRGGPPKLTRRELCNVLAVAAGTVVVSNGFNMLGMRYVASNVSALLNASPAFIIAWLGTFGRRATPLPVAAKSGLVLGFAGVALVLSPGGASTTAETSLWWSAVILAGCVGWALGTAYFRNATIENTPTMFLALQMLAGGACLLLWAALAGEPLDVRWSGPTVAAFLWLTVMSSCIAYSAYAYLALTATPVLVGSYGIVNPAVAALLGWLLLGEVLGPGQVAGMVVILFAVALVTGFAGRLVRMPRMGR
jgi:drug/metabolite transporter (DMT)-like permease